MLTKEEQQRLNELEQKYANVKLEDMFIQDFPINGLSPQENKRLQELESKYQGIDIEQELQKPEIRQYEEATLGPMLRAQYSIEPLESNRLALLKRELGEENVIEQNGEIFVNQDGKFYPVNAPGVSMADIADIAGATPEMVGAGAGAALGFGAGSVPGAIIGGAVGSAARQGLSALLGTPQEAGLKERALEAGISAATGGIGAGIGKGIAKASAKLIPDSQIDSAFKKSARKINLKLTKSQQLGKEVADLEKAAAEVPLFGRKFRKQLDAQIKEVKDNLTKQFGDFTDVDFDRIGTGNIIKEKAKLINENIKKQAANLFDEVAQKGTDITVNAESLKRSLANNLKEINILDEKGFAKAYNVKSNLTRDQFNKVQQVATDLIDFINETASDNNGLIDASMVNTLRKNIDANIKEAGKMGLDDIALVKLREGFLNVTEDMLGNKSQKLRGDFLKARSLWKKYLDDKQLLEKEFKLIGKKELADEKVINDIFKSTKSIEQFRNLTDDKTLDDASIGYIKNILSEKLGKDKQVSATGALKAIRAKREILRKSLGPKQYNNLIDNLTVLEELGESINPSRTKILDLKTDLISGAKALGQLGFARGAAKTGEVLSKIKPKTATQLLYTPTKQTLNDILSGE